jgi:hypothetical protein
MNVDIYSGYWDYRYNGDWIGGHLPVSNSSSGYHGILKQWWDSYLLPQDNVLLITEGKIVKNELEMMYPHVNFINHGFMQEGNYEYDVIFDLCKPLQNITMPKINAIVCQATLEHLFDPITALKNMLSLCNYGAEIYIHTHTPDFPYHPYPRDYLRFQPDWFVDIPKNIENLDIMDLCYDNKHIFSRLKVV